MSELTEEQLLESEARSAAMFDGPITGQSMTNDPNNPAPFEKAPQFTSLMPALEYSWGTLIQPKQHIPMMRMLSQEVPVMDLVKGFLFVGFQEGKWNPDLMIMMIEPVAYMLIALAERQDIDPVVYDGEIDDENETEELMGVQFEEEKIRSMQNAVKRNSVPAGILTEQMQRDLETLPDVELQEAPEPTDVVPVEQPPSLMARPE